MNCIGYECYEDLFYIRENMVKDLPIPKGRKYALNFALAENYEVDAVATAKFCKYLSDFVERNKILERDYDKVQIANSNQVVTEDGEYLESSVFKL